MSYLHTIGLENFRLFKDQTTFELAPITILTGINNSGKSSLIKSLQLFNSSLKKTGGFEELNFEEGKHNLGHYGLSLNSYSQSTKMKFTFDLQLNNFNKNCFIDLIYDSKSKEDEKAELSAIKIYTNEVEFIQLSKEHTDDSVGNRLKVDLEFLINHFIDQYDDEYFDSIGRNPLENLLSRKEWLESLKGDIFGWFHKKSISKSNFEEENQDGYSGIWKSNDYRTESEKFFEYLKNQGIFTKYQSLDAGLIDISLFHELRNIRKSILTLIAQIIERSDISKMPEYSGIFRLVIDEFFERDLNSKIKVLETLLKNSASLSSIRANSERLYFNNSSIVDINQLLISFSRIDFTDNQDIIDFINSNLRRFKIGDEIMIKRHQGVASEIFVRIGEEKKLLVDLGFGFTQLVPIILKIAIIAKTKYSGFPEDPYSSTLFLLEEPESNLHPSYQSKLAELIIDAARSFNIQFIIETHSEYLIRNFQYLTAIKKIPSNATKIYYFHQPGTEDFEESPYRVIEIMKDGRLSNEFGEGFFDEIPRLLAFLYNSNSN